MRIMAVDTAVQTLAAPAKFAHAQETHAAPFAKPTRHVSDLIWIMIVMGFVIVLIGSFLVLAATLVVFKGSVHADAMVGIFTTVVGFLAGLVTPSPGQGRSAASTRE